MPSRSAVGDAQLQRAQQQVHRVGVVAASGGGASPSSISLCELEYDESPALPHLELLGGRAQREPVVGLTVLAAEVLERLVDEILGDVGDRPPLGRRRRDRLATRDEPCLGRAIT